MSGSALSGPATRPLPTTRQAMPASTALPRTSSALRAQGSSVAPRSVEATTSARPSPWPPDSPATIATPTIAALMTVPPMIAVPMIAVPMIAPPMTESARTGLPPTAAAIEPEALRAPKSTAPDRIPAAQSPRARLGSAAPGQAALGRISHGRTALRRAGLGQALRVLFFGTCATLAPACAPREPWPSQAPSPPAGGLAIEWRLSAQTPLGQLEGGSSAETSAETSTESSTESSTKPGTDSGADDARSGNGSTSAPTPSSRAGSAGPPGPFELEFGAPLELELWLAWDGALTPAGLDLSPWAAAAPVELDSQRVRRGGAWLERRRLRLRPVELGALELPGLELAARAVQAGPPPLASTAPLTLRVRSSLPAGNSDGLELPAPLELEAPGPRWPWLLALLPLGLGWLWWARRRPLPPPDPLSEARRGLRSIPAQTDDARAAADLLALLLRAYLESTRGLPAARRSTPELLAALAPSGAAPHSPAPHSSVPHSPAPLPPSDGSRARPSDPSAPFNAAPPSDLAPLAEEREPQARRFPSPRDSSHSGVRPSAGSARSALPKAENGGAAAGPLDARAHRALAAALDGADQVRFAAPGDRRAALTAALEAAARFLDHEAEVRR